MPETPLSLVTNDDGVLSPGLWVLAEAARRLGEVLVVAPEREMSGISHAITLHRPMRVRKAESGGFALDGTPVDCVYLGMHHLADRRPALVVSGVNPGANLGVDVLYSGTVAAAREATIQGIPGIAFSILTKDHGEPGRTSRGATGEHVPVLERVMRAVLAHGLAPGVTLNVNIPRELAARARFRATTLGRRAYSAEVVRRRDPRGHEYLWIGGGFPELERTPGTDTAAIREGAVSVTPLGLFAANGDSVDTMATWPLFRDDTQGG